VDGAEEIPIARAEAVINAATCLESFVYSAGSDTDARVGELRTAQH
jgi:hypothetical protein